MNAYFFCILMCLSVLNQISASNYEYINDCIFIDKSINPGRDEITFICSEIDREDSVFSKSNQTICSNRSSYMDYSYKWHGTIDFRNCRFPRMKKNYFELFVNMHTFNISNVELETMQLNIFCEAKNVVKLDLSKNKLTEIPSHIFFNGKKLKFIDFSGNAINRIDPTAFEGAIVLETLDLSQNHISELLDSHTLSSSTLRKVDLSYNNLTELSERIFDNLTNLELLDLSCNAIGDLDIKIFSHLVNLKDLKLRQTNLSIIKLGTFSQQHNLVSLDLSENHLKKLDMKLFFPILPDLQTLNLASNQLENLNGFRNSIFPEMNTLLIQGNPFSCEYLAYFMEKNDWQKIRLSSSDVNSTVSTVLHKSNIRGIGCNDSIEELGTGNDRILIDGSDYATQIDREYKLMDDDGREGITRILLTFISVVLTVFLILFTIANSDKIFRQLKKIRFCQRIRTYSSSGNVVEFTNELSIS